MNKVLLVRHADIDLPRIRGVDNPPLNPDGGERAKALARVVGSAGITAIFTSSYARTKETVEPLAARLGLVSSEVPPPTDFAAHVLAKPGSVFLVAGHSDTVREMITALGVTPPIQPILKNEFDNLFVVFVDGPTKARLVRLKYGEPFT